MYHSKKWSIALMCIIGCTMLTLLYCLVGSAPAFAASEGKAIEQTAANPQPEFWYHWPLTDPWPIKDNIGNLLGMGVVQGEVQGRDDRSANGQISVQLLGTYQFSFSQVDEVLVDANQNPVGAVLSGQGEKNVNGRSEQFNFTSIVHYSPNGACCEVRILSPAIHASGGIRFEGPGELRFERQ